MMKLIYCLLLEVPDSFFCLIVLEVSIHSTVRYFLAFYFDCLLEGVVYKAAVVSGKMIDIYNVSPGLSLKCLIRLYYLL